MWAKHLRKGLPTLGDHTTNRVERMFWTLKRSIREKFVSLPKTVSSIQHIVKYAENRLVEKTNSNTLQSLRIYSSDPFIRELNTVASLQLNHRGCMIFNRSLEAYKKFEDNMKLHSEGVIETFKDTEKIYITTKTSCNCSFMKEHQSPCRHVIFLRTADEECDVFSLDIFNKRYHRVDHSNSTENDELIGNVSNHSVEEEVDDHEEADEFHILSEKERFKHVMPILIRIGNLISKHSDKDYHNYIEDLDNFEKSVRRRQRYQLKSSSTQSTNEATENVLDVISPPLSPSLVSNVTETEPVDTTDGSVAKSSRFRNLEFKEKLKKKVDQKSHKTSHISQNGT